MRNLFFTLGLVACFSVQGLAQTHAVQGSVFAFRNMALKNIKVTAKKTKSSVLTDSLGQFNIVCAKKDKLIFEGNGFARTYKKVGKEEKVRVKMMFIENDKNEELAVGYGHMSQAELTFAVNNLSVYNNDFSNFRDVYDILVGRFPGVQVVNNGGGKNILIRGVSSTSANIYALLIVDGVEVSNLDYLPTTSVKSIDVLKEGTIYGSRGANGVVLITTIGN